MKMFNRTIRFQCVIQNKLTYKYQMKYTILYHAARATAITSCMIRLFTRFHVWLSLCNWLIVVSNPFHPSPPSLFSPSLGSSRGGDLSQPPSVVRIFVCLRGSVLSRQLRGRPGAAVTVGTHR